MKSLLLIAMSAALLAPATWAGLDPNPDSFGVYFDTAGNINNYTVPIFTPYDAYLLVVHPSAAIDGFECAATRSGAPYFVLATTLEGGGIDEDPAADVYRVQCPTPYPVANGAIVAVHWRLMQQASTPLFFYVAPTDPPSLPGTLPVLRNAGALRQGRTFSGSPQVPVACVNWYCFADERSTFGAVKSLFR